MSLFFGKLANIHPRVLTVKIDGATKEEFVWGFRVGFITFAHEDAAVLHALEQKHLASFVQPFQVDHILHRHLCWMR